MDLKSDIIARVRARKITVGVVGLGYVGLPLAVENAKSGFCTIGFDVQSSKVEMVNRGENYIGDIVNSDLESLVRSGMLRATSDFNLLKEVDFVAICVPTPLDAYQQPDISYVKSSVEAIGPRIHRGTIVVLESTTYPGTTEELVRPILEKESGLECGVDFYLGFSPERVDPGNSLYKTKNTPKVVGAIGDDAREVIAAVYREVLSSEVHTVSSPRVAEMEKILENTYRNVNIGLVNELSMLCHRMDINLWEVIEAAKTKPYGFQAFYPGPGLGGHCIPLDPYYLSWKAREYGFHTSMIEASMMVNDRMPEYCVDRVAALLNDSSKPLRGAKILQLGIAYKQDIDDYRESPAIRVYEELRKRGADVAFFDPYIPKFRHRGEEYAGEKSLSVEKVQGADLVVITTAHSALDYAMVQKHARCIFDTKNAMSKVTARSNVHLL